MDKRPIGIFDSGVGGLSIFKKIYEKNSNENYIYFGDVKRAPYGKRNKEEIIEFSKEILSFLLEKEMKICVVACNTICVASYTELKKMTDIPIINIVDLGVKSIKKTGHKNIGILGTTATIKSKEYRHRLEEFGIKVTEIQGDEIVRIVEKNLQSTDLSIEVAKNILSRHKNKGMETLFLGCTHFPFIEREIKEAIGKKVQVIYQGDETAKEVKKYLMKEKELKEKKGWIKFYSTDDKNEFDKIKNKVHMDFKKFKTEKVNI